MPPSPNRPETTTATPMSPPARASRATSAIPPAATSTPAAAPNSERHPGERGDHEAGQHRVRERFRRVRPPQQQDPDAQRPAREPEDDRLDERALHDPAGQHQLVAWSWCETQTAWLRAVEDHELVAVGRGAARRSSACVAGAPKATWPWLRHSTRGHALRLRDVVGRHQQRAALGLQLREHALDLRRARAVDARQRLVEQQQRRVLDERAGDQDALALAAAERPEARVRPARRAPRARAPRRPSRGPSRATRLNHGVRPYAPISATSCARDREVEPRALGLRHVRRPARELHRRPSGTAARPAARGTASSCRRRWARAPRRSRPPRP